MKTPFVVHRSPDDKIKDFSLVHVWFCNLDDNSPLKLDWTCTSPTERNRITRLKDQVECKRLTRRFIFVRQVIGNVLDISLNGWEFPYSAHGKPQPVSMIDTKGNLTRLNFNISHSENVLALAIALDCNIGIDIEVIKTDIDFSAIAKTQFDKNSFNFLNTVSSSKIDKSFYRLWTRKEALAKMIDNGIVQQPDETRLDDILQSLYSFEFSFGKKEIIGALAYAENL